MSFVELETITQRNMPPRAKLSYMRPTGRGPSGGKRKDDAKPQLCIAVPTTICGTAKAKTFVLQLGTGENSGKLRIKGTSKPNTGVAPLERKYHFQFKFGYVPRLGDDIFDGEHRDVRKISDDEFEIDIPASWFTPAPEDSPKQDSPKAGKR